VRKGYVAIGVLTVLASLPGWAVLLGWKAPAGAGGTLLLVLAGTPAGALLTAVGIGRFPRNRRSGAAARFAVLGFGFALCLYGALAVVALGAPAFMTAVLFSGMAFSYLSIMTLVFLVAARIAAAKEAP
jgi:hypothetical protein